MSDERLTREEFRNGVRSAIDAVLNVYQDVKELLVELGRQMADGTQRDAAFAMLGHHVVSPKAEGSDEAKLLRPWMGALFVPADDDEGSAEADEEAGDSDDDDNEGEPSESRKDRKMVRIAKGGSLLFAKVTIYGKRGQDSEPEMIMGCLTNCRVKGGFDAPGGHFLLQRDRRDGILAAVGHKDQQVGKAIPTKVGIDRKYLVMANAQKAKQKVPKSERTLVFDLGALAEPRALYHIDSIECIPSLAVELERLWIAPPA